MRFAILLVASCLVAALALTSASVAAPRPITGKLTKPGYTVIALTRDGTAAAVRASTGRFRLNPPARGVTLHLRGPDGKYAGPIVVGRVGKRAIVGVRAGARLGEITVRPRKGYAKVSKLRPRRFLALRTTARARNGVPIGARVFGRVRSRPPRRPVPGDSDFDGVPDALDVDDDGDLILDDVDGAPAARASQSTPFWHVFADLGLGLEQTVNANPRNSLGERIFDDADIDAALPSFGVLLIGVLDGDSAELDCSGGNQVPAQAEGLVYCSALPPNPDGSRRSTGTVVGTSCCPPVLGNFPEEFDADGDGFGTLIAGPRPPAGLPAGTRGGMGLRHGATSAQIGTGDTLIQWVAKGIPEDQCPPLNAPSCTSYLSMERYIFATVPALVSVRDGQGDSTTVSYPVPGGGMMPAPDNSLPVAPCPAGAPAPCVQGEVVVTLTFWRPQRRPMPGEPGYTVPPSAWTDVGGLAYAVEIPPSGFSCPPTAFSTTDPNLSSTVPAPGVFGGPSNRGGLVDTARDEPADPANTLTYSLNLTQCLAVNGLAGSFDEPGELYGFTFDAINPRFGGRASQTVTFKRK